MKTMVHRIGRRSVIASRNDGSAKWTSRLYVNDGETATHTTAKHLTVAGAKKWAKKILGSDAMEVI